MRVLVTGAAGFIGSNLVDRLLARGNAVVGLDNFDPFYSPAEKRANLAIALSNPGFRFVEADVVNPAALDTVLGAQPVDVIIHLAAKTGVRPSMTDPASYERVNVGGTRAVLAAASRRGVKGIVLASSSSVYGNGPVPFCEDASPPHPISPYATTKRSAELLCLDHQRAHGGSALCLRLFTAYGPRQRPDLAMRRFCTFLSAGCPVPVFGDGHSERDYTWIDDILDGLVAAIERAATGPEEFEIVNLGAGRAVRLSRLVELLAASVGVELTIEHLPGHPADAPRTCADLTKAHRLLGYTPRVPIEDGIERFVRWFLASPLSRMGEGVRG